MHPSVCYIRGIYFYKLKKKKVAPVSTMSTIMHTTNNATKITESLEISTTLDMIPTYALTSTTSYSESQTATSSPIYVSTISGGPSTDFSSDTCAGKTMNLDCLATSQLSR